MADRVEIFDVECPANTPATAPIEVATAFDPGLVEKVWVVIPDGHAGLTGIALAVGHETLIPFNRRLTPTAARKFIEGNDESIPFDLSGAPDSGAWSAFLFNVDVRGHAWQLRFEINELPRPVVTGAPGGGELALTPTGELAPTEGAPTPGEGEPPSGTAPEAPPAAPPGEPAPVPEAAPPAEGPVAGEGEPPPPAPPAEGPQAGEPEAPAVTRALAEAAEREAAEGTPPPAPGAPARPPARAPARGRQITRVETKTIHETRPAGGWLPHGARYTQERVDQGQDFITNWRGPIIAAGHGYVVAVLHDRAFPDGFGPNYAVVHIEDGPFAGHDWYLGHATAAVHPGQRFKEGQVLAHADQGHVQGGGWVELGEAPGGTPGSLGNGARWHHLFAPRTITRTERVTVKVKAPAPAPRHPPPRKPAPAHPRKPPTTAHREPSPARRAPSEGHRPAPPPERHRTPPAAPHAPPAPRRAPPPPPRPAPRRPAPAPPRRR